MHIIILFLLILVGAASKPAAAKTFKQSFEEAQTIGACKSVGARCSNNCDSSSISNSLILLYEYKKGGNSKSFDRSSCINYCKEATTDCLSEVESIEEEKRESAKEAQEKAKEAAAESIKKDLEKKRVEVLTDRLKQIGSNPPSFTLMCGSKQFSVWEGLACGYGTSPEKECTVNSAKISWSSKHGSFYITINRLTGVMEETLYRLPYPAAPEVTSAPCQKVTSEARKF